MAWEKGELQDIIRVPIFFLREIDFCNSRLDFRGVKIGNLPF